MCPGERASHVRTHTTCSVIPHHFVKNGISMYPAWFINQGAARSKVKPRAALATLISHSANVVRRQIYTELCSSAYMLMHNAPLSPKKSHCVEKGSAQIAKTRRGRKMAKFWTPDVCGKLLSNPSTHTLHVTFLTRRSGGGECAQSLKMQLGAQERSSWIG